MLYAISFFFSENILSKKTLLKLFFHIVLWWSVELLNEWKFDKVDPLKIPFIKVRINSAIEVFIEFLESEIVLNLTVSKIAFLVVIPFLDY